MRTFTKLVLSKFFVVLGYPLRLIPVRLVSFAAVNIIRVLCTSCDPKEGLRLALMIEKGLYSLTTEEACRYNGGMHTKHRHTRYHDFFCDRLRPSEEVLDIGCGGGALSYDMAFRAGALVTGIDLSSDNLHRAKKHFAHPKISYVHGDVCETLPKDSFETVVMSNVLEHVDDRIDFLRAIQRRVRPKRWLFRVPMYERDWRVPLMEEIGVDYRLDITHCIEHTQQEFEDELNAAGLYVHYLEIRWGEIWCEAKEKRS